MELNSRDWSKLNECILRLHRELDTQAHTQAMLEIVRELVPVDSVFLSRISVVTFAFEVLATHPENVAPAAELRGMATLIHQLPFPAYFTNTFDNRWKQITDFMPTEDFHATELYRRYLNRLGINHIFCSILAVLDNVAYPLTIHRTHPPFTEYERELLNTLQPHLTSSFIKAQLRSESPSGTPPKQVIAMMETPPGAHGYFDAAGKVAWVQPQAQAWLRDFFPNEPVREGNVPEIVWRMVQESAGQERTPKQMECRMGHECLRIYVGASPLGGWLLWLDRRSLHVAPHFTRLPDFSPRKNDILKWMVEGKTNAEIAAIVKISRRTVEQHVAEILQQRGVENRATAIIRTMELCAAANNAPAS